MATGIDSGYLIRWLIPPLSVMMWTALLGCALLLCVGLAVSVWVRLRGRRLRQHLRVPGKDGKTPLVVAFFHPYCNAGGGGERVLWVAIRALYKRYPHVKCVVYTGDTDATSEEITARAKQRFNIRLPKPVEFVFLNRRSWVEASPYPYFTLLCQSLGSLVLGWEAVTKLVPDVYIDSMGYAFTLPLFRYIAGCRVLCYVHYPTISTDMLERVSKRTTMYNNARFISRSPTLSYAKLVYYRLFAFAYGLAGKCSEVIMTNSNWTQGHILRLWRAPSRTHIVYPPCDTAEFLTLPLTDKSRSRSHSIVSVAQFRPEKDHALQLKAFHRFLQLQRVSCNHRLILAGGCRNEGDARKVEELRGLAGELGITERVEFKLNISFNELKDLMATATVGLHTMQQEHFGIGVVELMAAGTLTLAHDSGGPKLDIVTKHNGHMTGFLADTVDSYAEALDAIFKLSPEESFTIRTNARDSVSRFSDEEFEKSFIEATALSFN